jgi:hypothetical protein
MPDEAEQPNLKETLERILKQLEEIKGSDRSEKTSQAADAVFDAVYKKIILWLTVWAVPFAVLLAVLGWTSWDVKKLGDDLRKDAFEIQKQIPTMQASVAKSKSDLATLDNDITNARSRVADIAKGIQSQLETQVPAAVEAAKTSAQQSNEGWVYYGWRSDKGLQQHYFRNDNPNHEGDPQKGDIIVATGSLNIRPVPNTFSPTGELISQPPIGLIRPGDRLKVNEFRENNLGLWVQFTRV